MIEAVGYSRCSGASQVDGDTWNRQSDAIRACCSSKGFELIREYRDEAIAGKLGEESRPGFQQMVADLLGNGCRIIVIEGLDRLARAYDIQQQLATYLASKGLTLISANTGEDITAALMGDPMRRALVQIQGIFAELDKNMLIAKLRKARERKRDREGKGQGRKAYGERSEEADGLAAIRKMIEQGESPTQITAILNYEMGRGRCKTRSGKPWRLDTVSKIVKRLTRSTSLPPVS